MKKLISLLLVAIFALSLGTSTAFARSHCENFTDADKNGICDRCGRVDANGDGICDNCPNGGVCPQDGTGRRASKGVCGKRACSKGAERNCANSNCTGFTDKNGDGVCDNFTAPNACPRGGCGAQGRCGRSK